MGSHEADWALDIVRSVWRHESGANPPSDDDRHPMERCEGDPDDPFALFGWTGSCPEFKESAVSGQIEIPVRPSAETKTRDTLLTIIAGLMRSKGLDVSHRETAGKVATIVTNAGLKITADTVRKVLAELPDAERRRKTKPP